MANGKVCTGFSKPYVAKYTAAGNTITYENAMPLARGVDVSVEVESSEAQHFHADNVTAETVGGMFTGGTVTLAVDGLKKEARKFIMGLVTTETVTIGGTGETTDVGVEVYDDMQEIPYMGIGFIARYMENGVTTYAPILLTKTAFNVDGLEAATQEEEIEFQTQELEATLMRDDSATHAWRKIADDQSTEAAAEEVLRVMLGAA